MNVLLIHDTRTVGFLNGVVLHRLRTRQGCSVTPVFGFEKTKHSSQFWHDFAPTLSLTGYDEIILCCVTFESRDPDSCVKQLIRFRDATNKLTILSHRWPDGYEQHDCHPLPDTSSDDVIRWFDGDSQPR
jgi:hypothetical protein